MWKSYDDYNSDFILWYKQLRQDLFEKIKEDSGVDVAALYKEYSVFENEKDHIANASLKWNDTEKNNFLLERTDYLYMKVKIE